MDNGFGWLQQEDGKIIVQTPTGYQIKVLSKVSLHVIDEIFLMLCYGKPNLSSRPVIDVGSPYCDSLIYFPLAMPSMMTGTIRTWKDTNLG